MLLYYTTVHRVIAINGKCVQNMVKNVMIVMLYKNDFILQ